ncbi:MAG: hypothetical protein JZU52_04260 [Lamprocystis purpurea]|jgi:hypothetical protein|uniref:hypothetical protein n=1 Tax=Lamprocystis purpurea TaxID=61598 RepID=UPI00036533BC|nr:hypothetical protein [Lamprocystis purpurea]MBV5272872.1 hypothetical protein [Lamprocystis purpurea]
MRGLYPLHPTAEFLDPVTLLYRAARVVYQAFRCFRALIGGDKAIVFRECHLLALALVLVGAVLLVAVLTDVLDPA